MANQGRLDAGRVARDRLRHERRRAGVLAVLAVAALLVVGDLARNGFADETTTPAPPRQSGPATQPVQPASATFPETGPGTFAYASEQGKVLGTAGTLRRYRVAVEKGMGQDPAAFAATVDGVLGDPRSWIASRQLRLQRVPAQASAEFTVFLATPGTSAKMCASGGLYTDRYTSCRLPGKVIINVARWLRSVPSYGAPLAAYQAYAINHEVGHQLGHGHEACPGPGQLAPVMQQQTLGLRGCVAYGWPYLDGRRYEGAAVP
jgi:hypothetical protein